jgi:hypothetical protein
MRQYGSIRYARTSNLHQTISTLRLILHDMLYILMLLSVIYFRYTTHSHCISRNSEGSKKLPDDGRLLPKHVGASTYNKGCYKSVHIVGHF